MNKANYENSQYHRLLFLHHFRRGGSYCHQGTARIVWLCVSRIRLRLASGMDN